MINPIMKTTRTRPPTTAETIIINNGKSVNKTNKAVKFANNKRRQICRELHVS